VRKKTGDVLGDGSVDSQASPNHDQQSVKIFPFLGLFGVRNSGDDGG
jgi:hypothetical protein